MVIGHHTDLVPFFSPSLVQEWLIVILTRQGIKEALSERKIAVFKGMEFLTGRLYSF
jgi:hypothetical protein